MVKNLPAMQETQVHSLVQEEPWSGRSPGEGNSNPLQYSCLETPMDRGAWRATVQWVLRSWTEQLNWTDNTYIIYNLQIKMWLNFMCMHAQLLNSWALCLPGIIISHIKSLLIMSCSSFLDFLWKLRSIVRNFEKWNSEAVYFASYNWKQGK